MMMFINNIRSKELFLFFCPKPFSKERFAVHFNLFQKPALADFVSLDFKLDLGQKEFAAQVLCEDALQNFENGFYGTTQMCNLTDTLYNFAQGQSYENLY